MPDAPIFAAHPEEPKKSLWDKIGAGLPVALTAVATAFAGMSTSEMSNAMYWRSAAAQDQAKTNDQWTLAGFKRDRALIVETTAVTLRAQPGTAALSSAGEKTPDPEAVARVRGWMRGQADPPVDDPGVRAVLNSLRDRDRSEAELVRMARALDRGRLDRLIHDAEAEAGAIEKAWDAEKDAARKSRTGTDGQAAVYEIDGRRYQAEAALNQWVGFLYEVRVKASTAESDKHRDASRKFFYAMLGAQLGATVAALGLARRRGSALWLLAGIAGLVAVAFGAYVYYDIYSASLLTG